MKRRRLSPAFVVTLAALGASGCKKPTATSNTPDSTAAKGVKTASAGGDKSKPARSRPVRDPLPEWKQYPGKIDYATAKAQNPKDEKGRVVFAGRYGGCYVELPFPADKPAPPPGAAPPTEAVDCPDAMQDPAWDTCIGGRILVTSSGDCACDQTGNPPPPPALAECPKGH